MRRVGVRPGDTRASEPILDHDTIVDIGGGPNIASAVSNPVAPAINDTLKIGTTIRSFSFSLSAGSIIGRTRDLVYFLSDPREVPAILTRG